jgi:hypothetical protein
MALDPGLCWAVSGLRSCLLLPPPLLLMLTSMLTLMLMLMLWLNRVRFGGMIGGQFNLYWYQDCFNQCKGCEGMTGDTLVLQGSCTIVKDVTECTPHFFFFGWQVASTGAGAAAINTLVSQVRKQSLLSI